MKALLLLVWVLSLFPGSESRKTPLEPHVLGHVCFVVFMVFLGVQSAVPAFRCREQTTFMRDGFFTSVCQALSTRRWILKSFDLLADSRWEGLLGSWCAQTPSPRCSPSVGRHTGQQTCVHWWAAGCCSVWPAAACQRTGRTSWAWHQRL